MAHRHDPGPPRPFDYTQAPRSHPTQANSHATRTGTGDSQGFPSSLGPILSVGPEGRQSSGLREPRGSIGGRAEDYDMLPPSTGTGAPYGSRGGSAPGSYVPLDLGGAPPVYPEPYRQGSHATSAGDPPGSTPGGDGSYPRSHTGGPPPMAYPPPRPQQPLPAAAAAYPATTPPQNGIERLPPTRPSNTPQERREFNPRDDSVGHASGVGIPPPGGGPGPFGNTPYELRVPANQDPTVDYGRTYPTNPQPLPPKGTQWEPRVEDQIVGELETKLQVLQEKRDRERDAYEQHIAGLQQTLQTLSVHLENERDRNRSVQDVADGRKKELDGITDKHKRNMYEQQVQHKQAVQQLIAQEREKMEKKMKKLHEVLRVKEEELQSQQQEMEGLKQHNESLQRQMEELKSWLDRGAEDFSSMFTEIQSLKDELEHAQRQLADRKTAVLEDRDRLEQTIDVLAQELRSTNELLAAADQEKIEKNAILANALASSKTMEDDTATLKARLHRTTEALHELEVALRKIKEQSDAIDAVKTKFAHLKGDFERDGLLPLPTTVPEAPPAEAKPEKRVTISTDDPEFDAATDAAAKADEGDNAPADADAETTDPAAGDERDAGTVPAADDDALPDAPPAPPTVEPHPFAPPLEHEIQVLLKKNDDDLNAIHDALKRGCAVLRKSKEKQIIADAGGSLNHGQLAEVARAATNTYHNTVNRARLEGTPEPQPPLYMPQAEAEDIFELLLEETRQKDGDVLDELLGHLVPADEVVAFDCLAEAARAVRGSTPPYPGLNLMDLLMMRLVTMTGCDIDQLLLHTGVPSYLNQKAWAQYQAQHQRNPDILDVLAAAMGKFATEKREVALTAVRPWLKTLGLLAALAGVRTQDAEHPHGFSGTQSVNTTPPPPGYPHDRGMVLLAPLHLSIGQSLPSMVTGVSHGRPLQNISQFPKEQGMILPIGAVLKYDGGLSEHLRKGRHPGPHGTGISRGPVYNFLGRVSCLALSEWIHEARVDSEKAAARLEEALTRRGIADAVGAANDRMGTMEERHTMETTLLKNKEEKLRKELDAVADTVIKTQNLVSEAYAERDDALGKYAEAERKRMKREMDGDDDGFDSPTSPGPVAGAVQQMCEDCNARRAEVMCTLCRARLCIVCSERIHSGGVMRSHPVRLLETKKKRSIINTSHMDMESAAEVRKLEAKYEKMKEKARQMRVDWDKVEEAHLMAKQIDTEKAMLQEYIKKLEQENHGLRTLTGGASGRRPPQALPPHQRAPEALPQHYLPPHPGQYRLN